MRARFVLVITLLATLAGGSPKLGIASNGTSKALLLEDKGSAAGFRLGAPIQNYQESTNRIGETRYESKDRRFILTTDSRGRIREIRTRSPQYFTQRFIQIGQSDMRAVLKAYGTPTKMERHDGSVELVYPSIAFTIDDRGGSPVTGFERLLRSRVSEIAITRQASYGGPP